VGLRGTDGNAAGAREGGECKVSEEITKHLTSLTVGLRGTDGNGGRAREGGEWEEELCSENKGNAMKIIKTESRK
jgi:hypothetical protein